MPACLLICPLGHSFARSFAHLTNCLLIFLLVCSFACLPLIFLLICSFFCLFAHLPVCSLICPLACLFAHLLICILVLSFAHSLIHFPALSLICPLARSITSSFAHLPTHFPTGLLICSLMTSTTALPRFYNRCTMGQNRVDLRHLIIHCPRSSVVIE